MRDIRRISVAACVMLVVLRMSIGWQMFYEGLWKYGTLETAQPWTAAGYLKNSRGPLRPTFREMAGDPDELSWLNYDRVAGRWDAWKQRFVKHYNLNENQQGRLELLVNGRNATISGRKQYDAETAQKGQPAKADPSSEYTADLEALPEGVEFRGQLGRALRYDPERKVLVVAGDYHLTPDERDRALRLVTVVPQDQVAQLNDEQRQKDELARKYQAAVSRVFTLQSRLGYKEKLAAMLKGDPDRTGRIFKSREGDVLEEQLGDVEFYRRQVERYERNIAKADVDFDQEHAQKQFGELQQQRAEVVGPVKRLETDLKNDARKLLSTEQLALGPVPSPPEKIDQVNWLTIGALTVLGFLLIAGLLSRLAAAAAAVLLFSFYLAMPPWPWLAGFHNFPGPDHSNIIDKNLIEVFALLAIACLPTGKWFGLDALFYGLWVRATAGRERATRGETAISPASPNRGGIRATKPTTPASKT